MLSGSSHPALGAGVTEALGAPEGGLLVERYAGGELHVELLDAIRGDNIFIVQPTNEPVERHLFELLLCADACYRAGAASITAVIPYFGYSRQDRRAQRGRVALGARLVADVIAAAHIGRVIAIDLHAPTTESFFAIPLEHITAVPLLIDAVRPLINHEDAVVVAPDLGAVKLAARVADALGCPMAAVHKLRVSGSSVAAAGLTGDVRGRTPIIVDDMAITGGTIEAAGRVVLKAGAREGIVVAVTHSALEPNAAGILARLPLAHYVTTNTTATVGLPANTTIVDITSLLVDVILRLTNDASLGAIRAET